MESHLRKLRKSKGMTLEEVQAELLLTGIDRTIPYLSLLERGLVWPSRDTVDSMVKLFKGEITELQILYPFRDAGEIINAQVA